MCHLMQSGQLKKSTCNIQVKIWLGCQNLQWNVLLVMCQIQQDKVVDAYQCKMVISKMINFLLLKLKIVMVSQYLVQMVSKW
jgi:hypothetical protein